MNLDEIDIKSIKNIKSKYLKGKIKKMVLNQRNIEIIEDLSKLENWVINGPSGFVSSIKYYSFKNRYSKEYLELLKELDIKGYKEYLEEEKEEKKTRKKEKIKKRTRNMKKLNQLKQIWK